LLAVAGAAVVLLVSVAASGQDAAPPVEEYDAGGPGAAPHPADAAPAADAGATIRIPPYKSPAEWAEQEFGTFTGNPPEERDDGFWYSRETHERLTMTFAGVKTLSDNRARTAWLLGYVDGQREGGEEARALRKRHRRMEASRNDAAARARRAEESRTLWAVTAAAVGAVVGVVIGGAAL